MKNQEIPRDLIYKFFRNQCTNEEHQKVMRWMKSASSADISNMLEQHIGIIRRGNIEYNVETYQTFKQVEQKINASNKSKRHQLIIRRSIQVAATILLLITSYYTVNFLLENPKEIKTSPVETAFVEHHSAYGEHIKIKLSDGSEVKLNAGTKLIHPKKFSSNKRELTLNGQAFFEVAKDSSRPFMINISENFQIIVLGTTFDVKSFSDDNISTVTVLSGKVKVLVKNTNTEIILTSNQQLTFDSRNNKCEKQVIDAKESIGWVNGILQFDHTPLADVFKQIERWYDVKIIVPDNLNLNCTVSGQHKNEGLNSVLEALQYSLGFQFQYINGNVEITDITCK